MGAGCAPTRRATWGSSWSTARSASPLRRQSRPTCAAWGRACCPCLRWCAHMQGCVLAKSPSLLLILARCSRVVLFIADQANLLRVEHMACA